VEETEEVVLDLKSQLLPLMHDLTRLVKSASATQRRRTLGYSRRLNRNISAASDDSIDVGDFDEEDDDESEPVRSADAAIPGDGDSRPHSAATTAAASPRLFTRRSETPKTDSPPDSFSARL
jgi:hypothetical protein